MSKLQAFILLLIPAVFFSIPVVIGIMPKSNAPNHLAEDPGFLFIVNDNSTNPSLVSIYIARGTTLAQANATMSAFVSTLQQKYINAGFPNVFVNYTQLPGVVTT